MATIAIADFLQLSDSIAAQVDLYQTHIASQVSGVSAWTGAVNNKGRVIALGDAEQQKDLIDAFEAAERRLLLSGMASNEGWRDVIKSLSVHVGGFNNYLTPLQPGNQVAPEFKDIADTILGDTIDKVNVFSPVINMGQFLPDGLGGGTFNDEDAIDNTKYPDAELELLANNLIGATDIDLEVTLTVDGGGGPFVQTVTMPATSPAGTTVDIDPGTGYSDVTLIAIEAGQDPGTSGDDVRVRSKRERPLVL